MIRDIKEDEDELVRIFESFSQASGMRINWENSYAYWFDKHMHKLECLLGYNWRWADEYDISKLLDTSFGLNINTRDVDQFLYTKIAKKQKYWSSMKLSPGERIVICNQMLHSTFWFFTTI